MSRRNLLALLGTAPLLSVPSIAMASGRRRLRVNFLTDMHLPASDQITDRARLAMKKANDCDILLFGGDNVMAVDHQPEESIRKQFDNWRDFSHTSIKRPFRSVLGNHDMQMLMDFDPTHMKGKERAADLYGMKHRYWTEKLDGWRFVGLDTVQQHKRGYFGHIDREQREWLRNVLLADRSTPTVIVSHMPILSVTAIADRKMQSQNFYNPIYFSTQVGNSREVIDIFREAGNVKLCLSGHTHLIDRCEFAGTTYICGGAVSGSWWQGPHQGFPPAYIQLDLNSDSTFSTKTVHCG